MRGQPTHAQPSVLPHEEEVAEVDRLSVLEARVARLESGLKELIRILKEGLARQTAVLAEAEA